MTEPHVESKRVGFLELFFDLVFVFSITQLVKLLLDNHTAAGWGRAAILLWLIWWAWSQYAWTGNAINLDRATTQLWILVATGVMLLAAAALPGAFGSTGLWFTLPYVAVRIISLGLYWTGLSGDRVHQAALRTYLPVQAVSLGLVFAGGFTDERIRVWLWLAAVVIDVISAIAAGKGEFRVDPAHFAERHGLIVIIALGESVIVIGATATAVGLTRTVTLLLAAGFIAVAGLWWGYFRWVHGAAEARLAGEPDHRRRAQLARDLFSFAHLPIVAGTVVFAAAIEEALAHPTDPLNAFGVLALALGPALYFLGFIFGNARATGRILWTRAVGLIVVVAVAVAAGNALNALAAVALVALVIVAVAGIEEFTRARTTTSPARS